MKILLPLLLSLGLVGCSQNPKPVVGAVNQFDSDTYLTLVTTDSIIQSTKTDLATCAATPAACVFTSGIVGNVKTALNGLISAYNAADASWQVYHSAALAGQSTPAQQSAVNSAIANVTAATVNLTSVKGGK